jgi:hypothetical protein
MWTRYVFYFEGTQNHCGYESYTLYQGADGWKVVSYTDTDNPLNGRSIDEGLSDPVSYRAGIVEFHPEFGVPSRMLPGGDQGVAVCRLYAAGVCSKGSLV